MPEVQKVRLAGRLLELVDMVDRYPKHYTATMLAQYFQVSVRTIRRDVETLLSAGIFVEYEPRGGYFIMRKMDRMPIVLTETERLVLALMPPLVRKYLSEGQAAPLAHVYERALGKILRKVGLDQPSLESTDFEIGSVIADVHGSSMSTNDELIFEILFATRRQLVLQLKYQKVGYDEVEDRMVDPYFVIPRQNSLYLVGFCHLRQDFRTFKISRMKQAKCTNQPFLRNKNFSLEEFMGDAWGIDQSGVIQQVTLAFSDSGIGYAVEELKDRVLLHEIRGADGKYIVQFKVRINPEFLRFILQYGQNVEVLSPPELREQLRTEAENVAGMYKSLEVESGID